jgi:hypothetical protein
MIAHTNMTNAERAEYCPDSFTHNELVGAMLDLDAWQKMADEFGEYQPVAVAERLEEAETKAQKLDNLLDCCNKSTALELENDYAVLLRFREVCKDYDILTTAGLAEALQCLDDLRRDK